jgi:hypothetical protein
MNAPTVPAGHHGAPRAIGIALVLIGALIAAASAASAEFDLGEDLDLGRAVHESVAGQVAAWAVAALLAGTAVVAVVDARIAGSLLRWIAIAGAVASLVAVAVVGLVDRGDLDRALEVVPFVVVLFTVPAYVVSVLLSESAGADPDGVDGR